jgi:NitT/TauT family transport system ATP-binding protein
MTALLRAEAMSKSYGPLEVLRDITLSVAPGEICCVVGPTGCGKSTLLRLFLEVERPDSGRLESAVSGPDLGVVFQEDALLPWRTVLDNVALPLELHGLPADERRERAFASLDRLSLAEHADRLPGELSGGTRQYVALARAMVGEPRLLIMDEPFGSLDPESRLDVETRMLGWLAERGVAVLFVTHNIEEAAFLGDRIVVLSPKPTVVKEVVDVALARPRSLQDPALVDIRRHVTDAIRWW